MDNLVTFSVSGESYNLDSFEEELVDGSDWKLHINKDALQKDDNEIIHTFFYSKDSLLDWASKSNPIRMEHPFNRNKYSIEVYGIEETFGGSQFAVSPNGEPLAIDAIGKYEDNIVAQCHSFMTKEVNVKPSKHLVLFGEVSDLSSPFFKASIQTMAYALCNELYDDDKVVVRGVRRLECRFGFDSDLTSLKEYQSFLQRAIAWVYEKDFSLRHKLLLDRITLDINLNVSFVQGLFPVIYDAIVQAKERYDFATYERQDDYSRELRDLLKDIESMDKQCSQKFRSIIANFSRDVLGALLLIGVTLLSKISELDKLSDNNLVQYVFDGYGIYFIVSACLQFVVDYIDISDTNNEFDYWKNISRNYISNTDFARHKKKTYGKRLRNFWVIYALIFLLYIFLAFVCFKAFGIWQNTQIELKNK